MEFKGLKILEKNDEIVLVKLKEILKQIDNGDDFYWSIQFFDGIGSPYGLSHKEFSNKIKESKVGFCVNWQELNLIVIDLDPIYWITLIGCKDKEFLKIYSNPQQKYETCDFSIELVDSEYYEIFTKDGKFYKNLVDNFEINSFLETDFLNAN